MNLPKKQSAQARVSAKTERYAKALFQFEFSFNPTEMNYWNGCSLVEAPHSHHNPKRSKRSQLVKCIIIIWCLTMSCGQPPAQSNPNPNRPEVAETVSVTVILIQVDCFHSKSN